MLSKGLLGAAIAAALITSGCAKSSGNVEAAAISPAVYSGLSCNQLNLEAQKVAQEANAVAGVQDKNATTDAVAMGVATVIFWPAAFFVKGNGENTAKLAQLKGQLNALEAASEAKNCGIAFKTVDPRKSNG